MDRLAALDAQFDPMRALAADETDLYVDWQAELGADDVKPRLVNAVARRTNATCLLFTGHRGAGKTTELNRVKQRLEEGVAGRRFFVSMLLAEQWVDLGDVAPEDVVLQVVRQLVADLKAAGFDSAEKRFRSFFAEFREQFRREVQLTGVDLGVDPLSFSFALPAFPSARRDFRRLLQARLPTIYDLVDTEILGAARPWLRRKGFDDVLIVVDQLDRIPQKVLNDQGLTNHENLFLDHAKTLRALTCHVLYTIPIELAYSRCHNRLNDAYGTTVLTLPAVPVTTRHGGPFDAGVGLLCDIVRRRADKAGVALDEVFESEDLLVDVLRRSGGYVRGLFVLLSSILDRTGTLPISAAVTERGLRRAAASVSRPLIRDADWAMVERVHATKQPVGDDPHAWNGALRDRFVLAYEDDDGDWYDWNPLLELAAAGRRG